MLSRCVNFHVLGSLFCWNELWSLVFVCCSEDSDVYHPYTGGVNWLPRRNLLWLLERNANFSWSWKPPHCRRLASLHLGDPDTPWESLLPPAADLSPNTALSATPCDAHAAPLKTSTTSFFPSDAAHSACWRRKGDAAAPAVAAVSRTSACDAGASCGASSWRKSARDWPSFPCWPTCSDKTSLQVGGCCRIRRRVVWCARVCVSVCVYAWFAVSYEKCVTHWWSVLLEPVRT